MANPPTSGNAPEASTVQRATRLFSRPSGAPRTEEQPDDLIGEPGRKAMTAAFHDAVARAAASSGQVSLTMIDLLGLKRVNEMFGRDDGDLVLAAATARMRSALGPNASLVRIAGDEFAVIDVHLDGFDELDGRVAALLAVLQEPFEVRSFNVRVGANIGVALVEPGADDLASVTERADVALYRAKLQGPDRFEVYEHSVHSQVSPAVIVNWLRRALDDGDLSLVYQPIHDMTGEVVVAVEALLRWHHPTEGLLLPDIVLPALEDSGLIVDVGAWVIDEACRHARRWRDITPHGMPPIVFVNVSPRQLLSPDFLPTLEQALDRHGVDANQICLELGTLAAVPPSSALWMLLRECKALGVRLALDNFGADDSSYGVIRRLRLDYLKLDKQLTSARNATPQDDAITDSVLSLARALGFETIAQGIEDPSSLERARNSGCDLVQGFYLGLAEAAEELDHKIAAGRSARHAVFH